MTLTGASGQTGDFIVAQVDGGTEKFVVEDSGKILSSDWPVFTGTVPTTKPVVGEHAVGELFFFWTTSVMQVGVGTGTSVPWYATMTDN